MARMANTKVKEIEELDQARLKSLRDLLITFSTLEETKFEFYKSLSTTIQFCLNMLESSNISTKAFFLKFLCSLSKDKKTANDITSKLLKINIIEMLFKEPNEQLLKEGKELIGSMASENALTESHVAVIWTALVQCREEKVSRRILDVIVVLSSIYGEGLIDMIPKSLSVLPLEEKKKPEENDNPRKSHKSQAASFQFLWKLIFELKFSPKLKEIIMDSFVSLLNRFWNDKKHYIDMAAVNFVEGVNIELTMNFLLKVKFDKSFLDRKALVDFIVGYKLIGTCMKAINKLKAKFQKRQENPKQCETRFDLIAEGNLYLTFLHELCPVHEKCSLSEKDLGCIWETFFLKSQLPEYRDLLWTVLKERNRSNCVGFFCSLKEAEKFFICFLASQANFPVSEMNPEAFECFKQYFARVNKRYISRVEDYQGIQYLWLLAFRGGSMQKDAENFITELYSRCITRNEHSSAELTRSLIEDITDSDSIEELNVGLRVLSKIIAK